MRRILYISIIALCLGTLCGCGAADITPAPANTPAPIGGRYPHRPGTARSARDHRPDARPGGGGTAQLRAGRRLAGAVSGAALPAAGATAGTGEQRGNARRLRPRRLRRANEDYIVFETYDSEQAWHYYLLQGSQLYQLPESEWINDYHLWDEWLVVDEGPQLQLYDLAAGRQHTMELDALLASTQLPPDAYQYGPTNRTLLTADNRLLLWRTNRGGVELLVVEKL